MSLELYQKSMDMNSATETLLNRGSCVHLSYDVITLSLQSIWPHIIFLIVLCLGSRAFVRQTIMLIRACL